MPIIRNRQVVMIDRPRLQRLALKKVQQEQKILPCVKCGSESFLFDFSRPVTVKTCKNISCKAVEVVEGV